MNLHTLPPLFLFCLVGLSLSIFIPPAERTRLGIPDDANEVFPESSSWFRFLLSIPSFSLSPVISNQFSLRNRFSWLVNQPTLILTGLRCLPQTWGMIRLLASIGFFATRRMESQVSPMTSFKEYPSLSYLSAIHDDSVRVVHFSRPLSFFAIPIFVIRSRKLPSFAPFPRIFQICGKNSK